MIFNNFNTVSHARYSLGKHKQPRCAGIYNIHVYDASWHIWLVMITERNGSTGISPRHQHHLCCHRQNFGMPSLSLMITLLYNIYLYKIYMQYTSSAENLRANIILPHSHDTNNVENAYLRNMYNIMYTHTTYYIGIYILYQI